MGSVCLPIAHQLLSRELQEWIPGVPQASSPVCSCRSPGCHQCFTAFIASHSWDCVFRDLMLSLLRTSSAFLLKTAMLVLTHISCVFPCPLWHADGITELLGKAAVVAACVHCQSLSRSSLSCAGLSDVSSYIPVIYELPLRSCSRPAGCPELSLWQRHDMFVSSASFKDILKCQQKHLEASNWAVQMAWGVISSCKPTLPCENNMIINRFYRILHH